MNDTAPPLEPEELDELLSAELDSELDAVARERHVPTETLVARIRATPGAAERRAALAAARDVLAETPDFDDLVSARIRAKAVRAAEAEQTARRKARARRRNRVFTGAIGIAAAAVVAVAIAASLSGHGNHTVAASAPESPRRTAAHPAATGSSLVVPPNAPAPEARLGTFTSLRLLALAAVDESATHKYSVAGTSSGRVPSALGSGSASAALPANSASRDQDGLSQKTAPAFTGNGKALPTCSAPSRAPTGDPLVFTTSATYQGQPVVVFVFEGTRARTVEIVDRACRVLNVQSIG